MFNYDLRYTCFIPLLISIIFFDFIKGLRIVLVTAPRDIRALSLLFRVKLRSFSYKWKNYPVCNIVEQTVEKHKNKVAFIFNDEHWTFNRFNQYSNQVANYFQDEVHLTKGDIVALYATSRPEYVSIWIGLSKLGCVTSLINNNLRKRSLVHCINASNAKLVIVGKELIKEFREAQPELNNDLPVFVLGDSSAKEEHLVEDGAIVGDENAPEKNTTSAKELIDLDPLLSKSSVEKPVPENAPHFADPVLYVFTSGTTGMPKAAVISNARLLMFGIGVGYVYGINAQDVIYNPLPLYHTAGGLVGVGQVLLLGATMVIKKKFSASAFWNDCAKYECTVAQYVGELCRYLLLQPERINDHNHKVRMVFGNGIRPNIWKKFQERFNIPVIAEFYGATEGNANLVNFDNTVGACGFMSRILPFAYPVKLIKVDEECQPIRDGNGLCIRAEINEPGQLVGKVVTGDPVNGFSGYVDGGATDKKIARNVFRYGDMAFLSGDILIQDEYGYVYFCDRTGDTFRWKGENVSTTEVEGEIMNMVRSDSVVFGVEVPNYDGRAGMACIVAHGSTKKVNLKELLEYMMQHIPLYSIPIFIRFVDVVETTATFKLKKVELKNHGYDPSAVNDPLFYLDVRDRSYKTLTKQVYEDILQGRIRF